MDSSVCRWSPVVADHAHEGLHARDDALDAGIEPGDLAGPAGDMAVGGVRRHSLDSVLLRGNPLGDPAQRPPWIHTPPGATSSSPWFPDLGAQAFRDVLSGIGVAGARVHFELFDGEHVGVEYRMPSAPAWPAGRIA